MKHVLLAALFTLPMLAGCADEASPSSPSIHAFAATGRSPDGTEWSFTFDGPIEVLDANGEPRSAWVLERHGPHATMAKRYYVDAQWRLVREDSLCPGNAEACGKYETRIYFNAGGPAPYGLGIALAPSPWLDHAPGVPRPVDAAFDGDEWQVTSSHHLLPTGTYTASEGHLLPSGPLVEVVSYEARGEIGVPDLWPMRKPVPDVSSAHYVPDWETAHFGTDITLQEAWEALLEDERGGVAARSGCHVAFSFLPGRGDDTVLGGRTHQVTFTLSVDNRSQDWMVIASRDALGRDAFEVRQGDASRAGIDCTALSSLPPHALDIEDAVETALASDVSHQGLWSIHAEYYQPGERDPAYGWGRYHINLVPEHVTFDGPTTTFQPYALTTSSATGAWESLIVNPGDLS